MDKTELLKSAKSSYYDAQKDIIDLTAELQNPSVSAKQNLVAFDGLLQLIMVNVAVQDGMFLKAEKDFIENFCDYGDIMQMAGLSWDAFLRFNGDALKNIIAEVNTKLMDLLSTTFSSYYELNPDKVLDLEVNISNICHSLACIDGDTCEDSDYIREWGAGMEIFDKAFKNRTLIIAPTKPVFYGFDKDYETRDISIHIVDVEFDCESEEARVYLDIKNKQHRKLRIWFKNIGIWSDDTDQEICDGYKQLAELNGYERDEYCYCVEDSLFERLYLTPCFVVNNPYNTDKCCSELVFMLTYDFGDNEDVDISKWVLDAMEFSIEGEFDDWEDDSDEEENANTSYPSSEFDSSSWNVESILRQEGYTVSQREGLTDYERQNILCNVINSGKMSKRQVVEHIELQINLRKNKRMYNLAIAKWERDVEFLRKL